MKYWKVNGKLIKATRLCTALHKFGQQYDRFGMHKPMTITIERITKPSFKGQGGKP